MSGFVYKYALKKTGLSNIVQVGDMEDPYNEPIPQEDLKFWQRKGAKRRRQVPDYYPENDRKILIDVRNMAYHLDSCFSILGIRVGYGGAIGLIPFAGDAVNVSLSLLLIKKAQKVADGIPFDLMVKMVANVIFDFLIGLIPIVGDFITIAYKANTRNFQLLDKHLAHKHRNNNVHLTGTASVPVAGAQRQEKDVLTSK